MLNGGVSSDFIHFPFFSLTSCKANNVTITTENWCLHQLSTCATLCMGQATKNFCHAVGYLLLPLTVLESENIDASFLDSTLLNVIAAVKMDHLQDLNIT